MAKDRKLADPEYRQLRRSLIRALSSICPASMADRRDDLAQNALIRLHRMAERSEGELTLASSYIWRVAHSVLIDEIRRERRRREVPLETGSVMAIASTVAPDAEQTVAGHQLGKEIVDCLGRLVRSRQLAVTLHLQGHTVPEVARILGHQTKKAENLVYRGLADLRRCLKEKGLEP